MDIIAKLSPIFSALLVFLGFVLALIQYRKQLQYRKLENLQKIWKDFSNDTELFDFFSALDLIPESKSVRAVRRVSNRVKLRFLGLLDEVAVLTEHGDVDRSYAVYLFQWHFYYAYRNPETMQFLWKSLGGEAEASKPYWAKSKALSAHCNPE